MDFGLLYTMQVARPHEPGADRAHFSRMVDQVRLAEEVGFSHVWHAEHHFLTGYSHSSASDVMLGAYAAATERIRLGYGVKLLPFAFNHPVKVAESVATLDQMSGGRVDFGTGRGGSRTELEGFGVDPHRARDEWREAMDVIVRCFEDGPVSWSSPTFTLPEREVHPKPVQTPHPPMWMAATGPESHTLAGELGLGLLGVTILVPLAELQRRLGLYWAAVDACTSPVGRSVNRQAAVFTMVHCAETDELARAQAREAVEWYLRTALDVVARLANWVAGQDIPTFDYLKQMGSFDESMLSFDFLDANDMCIVGSPDTCAEKVQRYREAGCTQLLGMHQLYGVPMEQVSRSIDLFGREVVPRFRDVDGAAPVAGAGAGAAR